MRSLATLLSLLLGPSSLSAAEDAWSHTPDIFDARTRELAATLKDEDGKPVGSSKLIEVHLRGGKVVRMSSEFGLGRKE